ncbi:DHH family phosphoesterase [Vibrio sp. Sgm 22]|uniref:DHH family phosphoesterase n=1 Tax=unclassified Vibrio TaxID=2614977 RepID=UPI002248F724|nr:MULTISPECIES: DHH family phosphoesterase [unclassified Vibrio]MCX2759302.1 DHH family phosphoesterase [Vibrio sp. 14G-20]MCX2776501.1 DHH family phosphoesterase [Vibrio sp. Sgm 22]
MANIEFEAFLERLKANKRVIVQAHDFPDHDAISSAYALAYLLKEQGLNPFITFKGHIDRVSLRNLIDWLEIPVYKPEDLCLKPDDKIIVIDGCIGEKNITDFTGEEVGVIDHHQVEAPASVWYSDIRSDYGATATIMVEYYQYFSVDIPKRVATALLVGLSFDTANFTRSVSASDLKALAYLQAKADNAIVNKICRNQVEFHELQLFNVMLSSLRREKNAAFAALPEGCPKNMLGVLGDFLLSVDELDIVVLTARSSEKSFISLRSECSKNNVAKIVRKVLNDTGIGFGGGHPHMAGGIINRQLQQNDELDYLYDLVRPNLVLDA